MVVDLVAVPAPTPTAAPEPAAAEQQPAVAEPPVPAGTRRRPGLLIAGAVLLAGLVAGGLVLFGQKKPLVVRVESNPPGATLELNGRILGVTPLDLTDPAPGARLLLTRDGFKPAEGTLRAGQTSLSMSLESLPPPPPPEPEPAAATPPPEPERQAEPKAEARRPETRPAAAPKARAPAKDEKRFDLYKHLEKQSQGK